MKAYLEKITTLPIIIVALVMVSLLLVDFFTRVRQPLNVNDPNVIDFAAAPSEFALATEYPGFLKDWLAQKGENSDESALNASAQQVTEIVALPGTTVIDANYVRVLAVFISAEHDIALAKRTSLAPNLRAIASVEIQDSETGLVIRQNWRLHDSFAEWQVTKIEPNRVTLSKTSGSIEQHIQLYVFEPSQRETVMPEIDIGGNDDQN